MHLINHSEANAREILVVQREENITVIENFVQSHDQLDQIQLEANVENPVNQAPCLSPQMNEVPPNLNLCPQINENEILPVNQGFDGNQIQFNMRQLDESEEARQFEANVIVTLRFIKNIFLT